LLDALARATRADRAATAEIVELLAEVDARRLYLPEGCSSLFSYCTEILHFTEHEAYHRIEAARTVRDFPVVLDRLRDGSLTLTAVKLLRRHLTNENVDALIAAASHKSTRDVEMQMARLAPSPDAASLVRRLPDPKPPTAERGRAEATTNPSAPTGSGSNTVLSSLASSRPLVAPLSRDRYLLRVTLGADAHAKLRRAQDLLRHTEKAGDPADIIDRALSLLVADLERRRIARVTTPRLPAPCSPAKRHVPAAIRREVWTRDQGRCAFVGQRGRCRETGALEFHHVRPFASGGPTTTANLELRCRAHNQYEGALAFGEHGVLIADGESETRRAPS
jgi:hypothetical protein